MHNVYHIFRDLRQFLLIVTLTPEVLLSNLQLYTTSFLFTYRFYKVFGRYLFIYLFRHTTTSTLCSVAILIEVMMTTIIERYYGWETGRI